MDRYNAVLMATRSLYKAQLIKGNDVFEECLKLKINTYYRNPSMFYKDLQQKVLLIKRLHNFHVFCESQKLDKDNTARCLLLRFPFSKIVKHVDDNDLAELVILLN